MLRCSLLMSPLSNVRVFKHDMNSYISQQFSSQLGNCCWTLFLFFLPRALTICPSSQQIPDLIHSWLLFARNVKLNLSWHLLHIGFPDINVHVNRLHFLSDTGPRLRLLIGPSLSLVVARRQIIFWFLKLFETYICVSVGPMCVLVLLLCHIILQ